MSWFISFSGPTIAGSCPALFLEFLDGNGNGCHEGDAIHSGKNSATARAPGL
jgi:hypothetical protein